MPGARGVGMASDRTLIIARMKILRLDIKQYFDDVNHWNIFIRKEGEERIEPDPRGELTKLLKALDDGLRREVVKGI